MKSQRLARLYVPAGTLLLLLAFNTLLQLSSFEQLSRALYPAATLPESARDGGEERLSHVDFHQAQAGFEPGARAGAQRTSILFLGNSQSFVVAGGALGQLASPQWLQFLLARNATGDEEPPQVQAVGLLDMTSSEFLAALVAAGESAAPPDALIGALSLRRSTNGLAVRPELLPAVSSPGAAARLAALAEENPDLPLGSRQLSAVLQAGQSSAWLGLDSQTGGVPERLETSLQDWLGERLALFAKRSQARNWLVVKLMLLRNRLFGICSATPRPLSDATYRANLELIELSLRYARQKGIHTALFLAPVRPLQPNPVEAGDLARFRRDLTALCRRYGAACLDYSDLLPERYWTDLPPGDLNGFSGQPDYYHFTGEGHLILAQQLYQDLSPALQRWTGAAEVRP